MKKLLTILLLISFKAYCIGPVTYYISNTGNNANLGISSAAAWQTIAKLNSVTLSSFDTVRFECGGTFYGTIIPQQSNIVYSYYGTGAKPIITGLTTITSWTNLGSNIWEATIPSGLSTLSTVVINGALIPMGRYPNVGTFNSGYSTYESFVGNTSITDNQLTGTPNWTGGQVLIRQTDWSSDRAIITAHSGTTLTYSTLSTISPTAGYGYFIENHPATLDVQNEWYYYDASGTKKIKMYSVSNPGTIQVSTLDNLVAGIYTYPTAKSNVKFIGLSFKGSEGNLISLKYFHYVTIDSCDLSFSGLSAIEYRASTNLTVSNSTISDINMCGIYEYSYSEVSDVTVTNNTLRRIGANAGMISPINDTYPEGNSSTGIIGGSLNLTIKLNVLDSIGYNGIALRQNRNNTTVRKNIVSNFCFVKNDGGGIYNGGQRGLATASNVYIDSNFIYNSIGALGGTTTTTNKHVRGIYLDATSTGVKVQYNTIFNCFEGIYMSQAQYCTIKNNTTFGCGDSGTPENVYTGSLSIQDAVGGYQHTTYDTIKNNIFFTRYTDQSVFYSYNTWNAIDSLGVLDSNYYVNTGSNSRLFVYNPTYPNQYFSLTSWRVAHPQYDSHSSTTPIVTPLLTPSNSANYLRFEYNPTSSPLTVTFTGLRYIDARGTNYSNSITIPAWSSSALIYNGTTSPPPTANAGANQVITLPINTTTLTGSGTGTIVAYQWVKLPSSPNGINFTSGNTASITITNLVKGVYQFELTVTDNSGAIGKDTVQVTVNPSPNQNPVVTITVPTVTITLPVNYATLAGTATDDGTVTGYSWSKVSGPSTYIIVTVNSSSTSVTNLVQGTYQFVLTATDNNNATGSGVMTVNVLANPTPVPSTSVILYNWKF